MIIFRVENDDGIGPYHGNMGDWCDGSHNQMTGRPMPYEDNLDMNGLGWNHRFGFDSMTKLLEWFSPIELRRLYTLGWRVVTFHVPDDQVRIGCKQVVFKHDEAKVVLDICPTAELNYIVEAA